MRILGTRYGFAALAVIATLSGLLAGCLLWAGLTVTPKPLRNTAKTPDASRAAASPSARLGELLVSPPSFGAGSRPQVLAASQPSVVTDISQDVRVLGVARLGRSGRALVSDPTGKARWIRVGQCEGPICVTAVGRSSAVLTIGGERRLIDIFNQDRRALPPSTPVIMTAPAGPAPKAPPSPDSGMVEPTLPPGAGAPPETQPRPQGGG